MFDWLVEFADRGGNVIYLIALVIFIISAMVFDRAFFLFKVFRNRDKAAREIMEKTAVPGDRRNTVALRLREVERIAREFYRPMPHIRSLIAICPLLGLLGTVAGMMQLFDSISFFGTGNSRAIISAVSQTTVPAMAGMTAALFGALADTLLRRRAKAEIEGVRRLL